VIRRAKKLYGCARACGRKQARLRHNAQQAKQDGMSERSFRATGEQPARRLGGATGRGFLPGRSGNPAGRPKGIEALAREHTAAAIGALVKALENPKERVPAAVALLNRGWGLPRQTIETDPAASPILLHLVAARTTSEELCATLARHTIDGHAESSSGRSSPSVIDLSAPLPAE
jgi:hypothetical protein